MALAHLIGRNHRRYGGYIIHLGVMMIGLAFIGDIYFQQETQHAVSRGESVPLGEYALRFDDLQMYPASDGREVQEATTSLFKNGEFVTTLNSSRLLFLAASVPVVILPLRRQQEGTSLPAADEPVSPAPSTYETALLQPSAWSRAVSRTTHLAPRSLPAASRCSTSGMQVSGKKEWSTVSWPPTAPSVLKRCPLFPAGSMRPCSTTRV